ncbi:competence/damage-inducible protein A [Pelistega ratti]|uniref:competence/damage-inducible protein A n=1 Tax=Pelistega ratti TaxID=2652177 RepID=UPI00135B840C|nr:molybdopterin-binding protein [Pelistega ratti]
MSQQRKFGLIVVGDEILSGRRQDAHFSKVIELLGKRGLQLSWAHFVPDDFDALVQEYQRSFASGDIVFSSGGIGSTPDDKTRDAVAHALELPLQLHPEAAELITQRTLKMAEKGVYSSDMGTPENQRRLAMGLFPQGAEIVPNAYNQIPGFFIKDHTFVPGFPEMAWSMIEWVLDTHYAYLHNTQIEQSQSVFVYNLPESRITATLEFIENKWPSVKTFSLPTVERNGQPPYIDLGVKGADQQALQEAFDHLKEAVLRLGGHFMDKLDN